MTITTVNPATGEDLDRYPTMSTGDIESVLAAAAAAQVAWRDVPLATRVARAAALASVLRARRLHLAGLATTEMGKPIAEALAEVDKCAAACDYYVDHAEAALADHQIRTEAHGSWIRHEPLGVVLGVMPWNFPYWQVIRFAVPTLLAGNTVLMKHASNVTGCALAIAAAMGDAGFPDGAYGAVIVEEDRVEPAVGQLVDDPRVSAVSLTGSNRAGASVAARAGAVVKKVVLELGGSDPFIVLEDADLDAAISGAVSSRYLNSGQSCLAAKRFIVARRCLNDFTEGLAARVSALRVDDPTLPTTQVGPMARPDLVDALVRQVDASTALGATVRTGGAKLPRHGGCWYAPTVLADVTREMPVMTEETFGPVAAVVSAEGDDQLVELANATRFGLGASVWSADVDRATRLAGRVQSGAAFVNTVVASDPRMPFGGVKNSGFGRELGYVGIREFTNVRSYVVNIRGRAAAPIQESEEEA